MSNSAEPRARSWRPWLIRGVKLLILIVVAAGIQRTVFAAIEQLEQHAWQWRPGWLALSGLLYLVGVLPNAWFWFWTMHRLGTRPSFAKALVAYYVGHLGKYVPGKGMVVVLRAGLVRGPSVDTRLAAAAVFYETLTTMAVGGALAALIMVGWLHVRWQIAGLSIVLALVVAVPTLPPIARRLIARLRSRDNDLLTAADIPIHWSTMGVGWISAMIGWIALGFSLEAALVASDAQITNPVADLPLCIAAVGLAVVAGFLSFLPGGAVVREAVLLELLVPRYGAAAAVVGAVMLRLAWLGAELITALVIWLLSLRGSS